MFYQKATSADLQGILDLQHKNFIGNLTDAKKKNGFLSVKFTREQFEIMNNETGIVVCKKENVVYGYLCTSSPEFNKSFELPAAMIALYPQLRFKQRYLDEYYSLVAGPWCIEQNSRGKGIFINMWNALSKILPKNIELITTFISAHNTRSLSAAKKTGMEEVTAFEFKEKEFCLLAKINN